MHLHSGTHPGAHLALMMGMATRSGCLAGMSRSLDGLGRDVVGWSEVLKRLMLGLSRQRSRTRSLRRRWRLSGR